MSPNDGFMKAKGDKDAILARFREGPAALDRALDGLTDEELDAAPAEGGWSIRQIVHHIADGDDIWKGCIKMVLGNEQAEFRLDWYSAIPQTEWAERWAYSRRPVEESIALLKAVRHHILQLLDTIPDGWDRSVAFREPNGESERISVGFILEMQADHVFHHIERILVLRKEGGY